MRGKTYVKLWKHLSGSERENSFCIPSDVRLHDHTRSTSFIHKWQEIADIIAEIVDVPSALVMKVEPPNIKVFVSSESNGNPYERDELAPLNTGLYCETVMKTRHVCGNV